MNGQYQKILTETLKSYQARNLYTEQQVAGMVDLLKKGELSIKAQLVKYSEIASLTPGQKVFQSRLKGLQDDLTRTFKQIQKDQTLLITVATKSSFQSGIQNGITELKNAKFPRWDILNSEKQERLAKHVFSLIDRNALDFMVRFNIQLIGNVHKELLNGIKQGITLGIIQGESIAEISRGLGSIITDPATFRRAGKTVFKTAQQRIELITRTETIRAHNQGRLKFFDTINVKRVKWMAVGDERMCLVCGGLDGKEYMLDNLPPIPAHPACRCTTVAARARVCEHTLKKYAKLELNDILQLPLTAVGEKNVDCILVPEQIEELAKTAKQEKSQVNKIIQEGKYHHLNGKTLQKLAQQRGIAVTRSKIEMIKLLTPLEPDWDFSSISTKVLKNLMKKHHISVLRSKDDLIKLLKQWDQAQQIQVPDYSKWSIIKLREEAKSNGISVMRTKDDLIKMLDSVEPGISHSQLKGKVLQAKLKQYNIGKVRTKEELIGLLTGKAKPGQAMFKADDLVKKQLAEQIKKAKGQLEGLIETLKPHELIADPTQLDTFMHSYLKGYEILAKNNYTLLSEDVSGFMAKLDSSFATWEQYIHSLSSAQLKLIVKTVKLPKWQWMNKDEMITLLTAKDTMSKAAAMESVLKKWEKWKLKHGGSTSLPTLKKKIKVEIPKGKSKPLGWNKVDSDWDSFNKTKPFKFSGRADVDGAHTKYFFTDKEGDKWLFKPVNESFRAYGDEVAYRIGR
jgi:SPP1 gp7 family putative phage head morphogenesis protein